MNRIPPQATDIERRLIASMLFDESAVNSAFESLRDEDFYMPFHRHCFEAMKSLQMKMNPIDLVTVENELKEQGIESDKLVDITQDAGGDVDYLIQIIKEKSIRRKLILACNEIQKESYDLDNTYDVVDSAQKKIFEIGMDDSNTLHELHESLQCIAEQVEKIQKSGDVIGFKCGLDIDDILMGFQKSKLYILGARPSMGKTALSMTIMRRLSKGGVKTGILSLETSHHSLAYRLVSQVCGISVERMTSGKMTESEHIKFLDGCKLISDYGIYIDDKAALTGEQLRSKARIMASKGVELLFVDFLQLVKVKGRSRHEEIGDVSKILKSISKEMDIAVCGISQLSRKVEERTDKRPNLSDLRESGSIEEDADVVMFLYRPEYYGIEKYPSGESTSGIAEVIVAKNKDGRTGVKKQMFVKDSMKFENLSRIENQSPF